jgi:hypothetical protein
MWKQAKFTILARRHHPQDRQYRRILAVSPMQFCRLTDANASLGIRSSFVLFCMSVEQR